MTTTIWPGIVFLVLAISTVSGTDERGADRAFRPHEDLRPVPACGPAAVTSLLALLGDDVLLSTVEDSFREAGIENPRGAVAVGDLLAVLQRHGRTFKAVRWPKGLFALRALPTPCIVHLKRPVDPDQQSASSEFGHFVTVAQVSEKEVSLVDLTGGNWIVLRNFTEFQRDWDGILIGPRETISRIVIVGWCLIVTASVISFGVVRSVLRKWKRKRHASNAPAAGLLFALLLTIAGCHDSPNEVAPPKPLLEFTNPSRDLGLVRRSEEQDIEFKFRVLSEQPVTITEITTCCGCRVADKTVIGKSFAAGTEHTVKLAVDIRTIPAPHSVFARVQTNPRSETPYLLAIQYQFVGVPKLSVTEVKLQTSHSQPELPPFEAFHWRAPNDPPVTLLQNRFQSADAVLEKVQRKSELVETTGSTVALDTTSIFLQLKNRLDFGEHRFAVRLEWSDGTRQDVPVFVRVVPPVRSEPDRVFLGIIPPNTQTKVVVPLRKVDIPRFEVASVSSSRADLTVEYDPHREALRLEFTSPGAEERIEAEIVVHFAVPKIPDLRIPVTGLVRKPSDGSASSK